MAEVALERARHEPVVIEEGWAPKIVRFAGKLPVHLILALIGLFWLVPTAGLFVTSILAPADQSAGGWWNFAIKPHAWTFENYRSMFDNEGITHALVVTAQITLGATILPILVASLAAYALAWIEFPGRDWAFLIVIALLLVPIQMALIPMFSLYNTSGLFDTIPGLILFHSAFALPFAIFLLRNFFAGIPRDLMEAARIDGASELRLFFKVILPLGLPAIASLAIFQVLFVWNDLLIGLVLTQNNQPIAPHLAAQLRQFGSNLNVLAPASFFSAVIPLTIFAAFQRYFVQGLLAGSVK
ncbi:MAG: carbohydrate ABC transporter permease [Thermoleophilia bacterium]|nr:carbohydrate ABC transporter permease [Thermoleophilia bacterium]